MDKNELVKQICREFVMETTELCDIVTGSVMDLEKNYDQELVNSVYRVFHTIKGNAYLAGYNVIGEISHKIEDVLTVIKSGKALITTSIINHLLKAIDLIKVMIDDIDSGGSGQIDTKDLMNYFSAVLASIDRPARSSTEKNATESEVVADVLAATEDIVSEIKSEQGADLITEVKFAQKDEFFNMLPKNSFRPLRILIVEDDFTSRQLLVSALKRYGDCHVAKDGLEAIQAVIESYEMVPSAPYDLICMDVQMPNMDGTVAARTIREIERGKSVEGTEFESVIMMISCVEEPRIIMKACYQCGANHYFVKPLNLHQMTRQMQKLGLIGSLNPVCTPV